MALSTAGKNRACDAFVGAGTLYASLHTADPGATGASEVTGGTYARKAVTWGTATGGSVSSTSIPSHDIPAGTTLAYFGWWTAASGGTWEGGGALSASETYGGAGTYTLSCTYTTT